jgi:hypothetical protein
MNGSYEDTLFHPGIGTDSCFLGKEGTLLYLIVPSTPILLINLIFFILTIFNLCCGIWSQDEERFKNVSKMSVNVCKIFLATGKVIIHKQFLWNRN